MTVIHKICGTKLISSGDSRVCPSKVKRPGDFGYCLKCDKEVHHLVTKDGTTPEFSNEVIIKYD